MALKATTRAVETLTGDERSAMFHLMRRHYENVGEAAFDEDLDAKDHVILLAEEGVVLGFSTLKVIPVDHCERRISLVYSGDTIIDRSRWGTMALPLEFIRYVVGVARTRPGTEPFWLLTSKGPRTYRFLPVFYRAYYPHHRLETPAFEAGLMETAARRLFGDRYVREAGVLRADAAGQRLRPSNADVPAPGEKNPDIAFFLRANPGFREGEELVCLADCSAENLRGFAVKRAVG